MSVENFNPKKTPSVILEIAKTYDNNFRCIRKETRFTERENFFLQYKMNQANIHNYALYSRKMCLNGFTITTDFSDLKALTTELGRIGNNINQLAHRANLSNSVVKEDFQELSQSYHELLELVNEELLFRLRRARDTHRFI